MQIFNFIIAVVALIIAIAAFQRTGGIQNLKKNTAELLSKVEKKMREEAPDVEEGKKQ
jgi:anaerobic C4-dicarboxylate transporter